MKKRDFKWTVKRSIKTTLYKIKLQNRLCKCLFKIFSMKKNVFCFIMRLPAVSEQTAENTLQTRATLLCKCPFKIFSMKKISQNFKWTVKRLLKTTLYKIKLQNRQRKCPLKIFSMKKRFFCFIMRLPAVSEQTAENTRQTRAT